MLFAVLFEDNPALGEAVRRDHMPAHLAFLEDHAETVRAAGPLLDTDGQMAGGLWLVEAPTAADVEALVKADPFWPTGLRKGYRILQWRQVFADSRRLI